MNVTQARIGGMMVMAAVLLLSLWAAVLLARSRKPPPPLPPYEIPAQLADEPLPAPFSVPLAAEQRLVYNNGAEPQTLDPILMTGVPGHTIALALFEGLTSVHPRTLQPVPGIAERWDLSEDGTVYTFHLRESKWSDGEPLTAADFVASWRRALDPATGAEYANLLYSVENAEAFNRGAVKDPEAIGVRALDAHTLEVRLDHPLPYFLELTAFATLAPTRSALVKAHGDRWAQPGRMVCNGPFVLAEWRQHDRIIMKKNPHYWNADRVALDEVHALAVDDPETALKMYLNGEVDWIRDVPPAKVADVADQDGFRYGPSLGAYYYRFNVTRPPLDDARVRKALNLAVDKRSIAKYLLRAGQRHARSFIPPILMGYTPTEGPGHDPDAARRLLAEAGYPNGQGFPRLNLLFNTSESHKQVAETIQYMWQTELGIRVDLLNQEWKVYLDSLSHLDYAIARSAWIGDYADPNTFLECFVTGDGNNRTGWSHAKYDALIRQAARETAPSRRMAIFQEAEGILVRDEMPIMPIFFYVYAYLVQPRVLGVFDNSRNVHPFQYMAIAAE
ncbi:peptide ABC transporter substrate-binding protein [bacterium]|nr:peptide ABC transporter substrate-binding protein [bacterium]